MNASPAEEKVTIEEMLLCAGLIEEPSSYFLCRFCTSFFNKKDSNIAFSYFGVL